MELLQPSSCMATKALRENRKSSSGGNTELAVSYGAKRIQLPFSLKLRDFILDKYPGTNSASSYASEVTLIDPRKNIRRDQRIYMNNILDHDGYRFFQSSFDQDELGTVLSVNHDFWGTWISYIGYILLTVGLVMTLFNKKSRFSELSQRLKEIQMTDKTEFRRGSHFVTDVFSACQSVCEQHQRTSASQHIQGACCSVWAFAGAGSEGKNETHEHTDQ